MNLLKSVLITIVSVSVPALSCAMEEDPMEHCPTIAAVKAVNFDFAQSTNGHHWMVGKQSAKYGTNFSWMFAVSRIKAADKNEALVKAKTAVNYLAFKRADNKSLSCRYTGNFEGQEIIGNALVLA